MGILLGIDTGGTFTDAVLIDQGEVANAGNPGSPLGKVIAKAKSLTTRSDLARGIAGSVENVLASAKISPAQITQVSLSTTLATNALVEGHGGRAALVLAGFSEGDIKNSGLKKALDNDPVIFLPGAHDSHGRQTRELDLGPLAEELESLSDIVDGFAIAGYFAVRNPQHELQIRDFLQNATGLPVTCSHELSDRLDGPKRALTTLLNARLIAMTARLVSATKDYLAKKGISCSLMVVRGDGSLVSAGFAMRRPIETILSGPAASLVGARWLTGIDNAFVSDIGGTTTDVAVLENGRPKLDADGARVGGFQTMVEAVAMNTFGLGGDSEVSLEEQGLNPAIILGPGRVVPVSMLAHEHFDTVHRALDRQLRNAIRSRFDGRFALLSGIEPSTAPSGASEQQLLNALTLIPQPLDKLLASQSQIATLQNLVRSGRVLVSAATPTDAMHVLGQYNAWDRSAGEKTMTLFARQKNGHGQPIAKNAAEIAERIRLRLVEKSADVILTTGFREDGFEGQALVSHPLVRKALNSEQSLVQLNIALDRPVIGLGASAHQFLPDAANRLGVDAIIPEHADVANAIGAVVSQTEVSFSVTISQPEEGRFVVSGVEQQTFSALDQAIEFGEQHARSAVAALAREAGAEEFETSVSRQSNTARIEGQEMFVDCIIRARATGRAAINS